MGAYEYASPLADTDSDGQNDYSEIVTGTDPTDITSVFIIYPEISPSNRNIWTISWQGITGRTYTVQSRESHASPWADAADYTGVSGTNGQMSYQDRNTPSIRFYRVRVKRP